MPKMPHMSGGHSWGSGSLTGAAALPAPAPVNPTTGGPAAPASRHAGNATARHSREGEPRRAPACHISAARFFGCDMQ